MRIEILLLSVVLLSVSYASKIKPTVDWVISFEQCSHNSIWTMHGLWPDPNNFCEGEDFDISQIESIRSEMDTYWISCPVFDWSNEELWAHEWSKHGTCSGLTQLGYFSRALKLRPRYIPYCDETTTTECEICLYTNQTFNHYGNCGFGPNPSM